MVVAITDFTQGAVSFLQEQGQAVNLGNLRCSPGVRRLVGMRYLLMPGNPHPVIGRPVTSRTCRTFRSMRPERLLIVTTDYFMAAAIWNKIHGIWSCTHAAPILRWMIGKNTTETKLALLKMDAHWAWSASIQPSAGTLKGTTVAGFRGVRNTAHEILSSHTEREVAETAVASLSLPTGAHTNRPPFPTDRRINGSLGADSRRLTSLAPD